MEKELQDLIKSWAIGIPLFASVWFGANELGKYLPKYAGFESKAGNIPITINGIITEGPFKGDSIEKALYESTKGKLANYFKK